MRDRGKKLRGALPVLCREELVLEDLYLVFFFWKKLRGALPVLCREELVLGDFYLVF